MMIKERGVGSAPEATEAIEADHEEYKSGFAYGT